jgi:molecular chaperone GrpE
MLSSPELADITERFRQWLAETNEELDRPDLASVRELFEAREWEAPGNAALLEIVEAFTAVRHEIKLLTKGSRGMQEEMAQAMTGLARSIDRVEQSKVDARIAADEAARLAARPLLDRLMDLDESIRQAITGLESPVEPQSSSSTALYCRDMLTRLETDFQRLSKWRRVLLGPWHNHVMSLLQPPGDSPAATKILHPIRDGLQLLQRQLARTLAESNVEPIHCVGRLVDPHTMRVVEVVESAEVPAETVLAELRRGYTWRDELIRAAEVRASRAS